MILKTLYQISANISKYTTPRLKILPPSHLKVPKTHHVSKHRNEMQATKPTDKSYNCWVPLIACSDNRREIWPFPTSIIIRLLQFSKSALIAECLFMTQ